MFLFVFASKHLYTHLSIQPSVYSYTAHSIKIAQSNSKVCMCIVLGSLERVMEKIRVCVRESYSLYAISHTAAYVCDLQGQK